MDVETRNSGNAPPRLVLARNHPPGRQGIPLMRLALINFIMNKYFYFAVIRFEDQMTAGATRPHRVPVTHFGKNAYATPQEAYEANKEWVCKHLGERFTVCGFPKQLKLDAHGISQGFVEDSADPLPF